MTWDEFVKLVDEIDALSGQDKVRLLAAFDAQAAEIKRLNQTLAGADESGVTCATCCGPVCNHSYARIHAAEAEVGRLQADQADTRASHAKLMRAIKAALGLTHWPKIEGNVVDGVCALLAAEVESLRAENEMLLGKADDYWKAKLAAEFLLAEAVEIAQELFWHFDRAGVHDSEDTGDRIEHREDCRRCATMTKARAVLSKISTKETP